MLCIFEEPLMPTFDRMRNRSSAGGSADMISFTCLILWLTGELQAFD